MQVAGGKETTYQSQTPENLIASAQSLVSGLRDRQFETEKAGFIAQNSIALLRDADLYRVLQPRKFGGFEHGIDTFVKVAKIVASGCGSTGWVFQPPHSTNGKLGCFRRRHKKKYGDKPL